MDKMPKANNIDVSKVKKLLKDCPKSVQNYVRALEELVEVQQVNIAKCIKKLRDGE